jgi:hypothetical protein
MVVPASRCERAPLVEGGGLVPEAAARVWLNGAALEPQLSVLVDGRWRLTHRTATTGGGLAASPAGIHSFQITS